MAERRMFSLSVVDTDMFLDMPASTQALYFHLGMRADDDGFVSSPRKIMSICSCNNDDLKLLISKGYVIPFKSGVCVITDWKINNFIRPDRYKETIHIEEKEMLKLSDKSKRYTIGMPTVYQTTYQMDTNGIPSIDKVSIGKVSIDKINNNYKGTIVAKKHEDYITDNETFINLPIGLQDAVIKWFDYKHEKKQDYKKVGAESILSQISNYYSKYGENALIDIINTSMANNYQGIIFDKLKQIKPTEGRLDWIDGSI